jgi:hypothetical protein
LQFAECADRENGSAGLIPATQLISCAGNSAPASAISCSATFASTLL